MLLPPLHGTLDFHDGLAVVVVGATLGLWTLLASLRERMRHGARGGASALAETAED